MFIHKGILRNSKMREWALEYLQMKGKGISYEKDKLLAQKFGHLSPRVTFIHKGILQTSKHTPHAHLSNTNDSTLPYHFHDESAYNTV